MEQITEKQKQLYEEQVKKRTPVRKLLPQMLKAFFVGGIICLIGQVILQFCTTQLGMDQETAGSWCSVVLVLSSVILTGMNVYPKVVEYGGCGALVPITGFANAMVSPALEFKSEGMITGTGAKLFTVAGPVLVFGISASILYGLILLLFFSA